MIVYGWKSPFDSSGVPAGEKKAPLAILRDTAGFLSPFTFATTVKHQSYWGHLDCHHPFPLFAGSVHEKILRNCCSPSQQTIFDKNTTQKIWSKYHVRCTNFLTRAWHVSNRKCKKGTYHIRQVVKLLTPTVNFKLVFLIDCTNVPHQIDVIKF